MTDFDQTRRLADQGMEAASANLKKGQAVFERSAQDMERNFASSVDTVRTFNTKIIEMAQTNSESVFEFAQKFVTAKSPSDAFELWLGFAQKQAETLGRQSQELAGLAQSFARDAVQPMTNAMGRMPK